MLVSCGQEGDTAELSSDSPSTQVAEDRPLFPLSQQGLYGFIDREGNWQIEPSFQFAGRFSEGLAAVQKDSLWGFVDTSGQIVIELQFEEAGRFREGRAPVMVRGRWGFVDLDGILIVSARFDNVERFSEGMASATENEKVGYLDTTGRWAIYPQYQFGLPFTEGFAVVVDTTGYFGFIDASNQVLGVIQYEQAWPFSEGLAAVSYDGRWGYIDTAGLFVNPPSYQTCWSYEDGMGLFQRDSLWGFLDAAGQEVIAPVYEDAWDYSEGLASVKKDDKWGFIDQSGTMVIPPELPRSASFSNGLAYIAGDEGYYINTKGERIVVESVIEDLATEDTLPVQPEITPSVAQPLAVVDSWSGRVIGLAAHTERYLVDRWKPSETQKSVFWGGNASRIMVVEAWEQAGELHIELASYDRSGGRTAKPLIPPGLTRSKEDEEMVRQKLLANIWYWSAQDYIPKNLRKFRYQTMEASPDAININWQGKSWRYFYEEKGGVLSPVD